MHKQINQQEQASVLALAPEQRYEHFVKRVADWRELWVLLNKEGLCLLGDEEGHEILPVWPHEVYARVCACMRRRSMV
jgi:hypothetical protein